MGQPVNTQNNDGWVGGNQELHWATTRQHAVDLFGEAPGQKLEAAIIEIFEIAPTSVIRAVDEVAGALQRGEILSGWPILHARLTTTRNPVRDVTVKAPEDRAKRIALSERWIANAGIHYDRPAEVEHELFGDARLSEPDTKPEDGSGRGLLHAWADDIALRQRMLATWREQRPDGEATENAAIERAERWKASRRELAAKRNKPDPDTEQAATPEPTLAATTGDSWEDL